MKKRYIYLLTVVVLMLLIIPIKTLGEERYKVKTYIDYPQSIVESNSVYIQGWVMSEVETDLKVFVDSNEVPNVERYLRNDVINGVTGYGNISTNPTPGFKKQYDVSNLLDGTHTLKIIVYEKNTSNVLTTETKTFQLKKYKTMSYIDNPRNTVVGETIKINGWVMSTDSNTKIEVTIDNVNVGNVERYERRDVLNAITGYGNATTTPKPGYRANYDVSNLNDGTHNIKVTVRDTTTNEVLSTTQGQFTLNKYKTQVYIDSPKNNIVGEDIYIQGWVMSSVNNYIKVYIDNNEVSGIERYLRNDVLNNVTGYGDISTNPTPGYKGTYDISNLNNGNHTIKINVYASRTNKLLSSYNETFNVTKYKTTAYIDEPTGNIKGDKLKIKGWVMSTANNYIKAYLNNEELTVNRTTRKDVLNAITGYGNSTTNPTPGFEGNYNISTFKDGNYTLKIEVYSSKTNKLIHTITKSFAINKYKTNLYIDNPTGQINGYQVKINGWVMSTAPDKKVEILVDNNVVEGITYRVRRDVLNAITGYGDETLNPTPGYDVIYDASYLKDGSHKITVRVRNNVTGEILSTKSQTFTLKKYKTTSYIDKPTGKTYGTVIRVEGWTMTTALEHRVDVYINNTLKEAPSYRVRNDVINAVTGYGDISTNPTPGFYGDYNFSNLSDGTVTIKINVVDTRTGEILNTKSQTFTLQKYKGKLYLDQPQTSNFSKTVTFVGWEMSETIDSVVNSYIDGNKVSSQNTRVARPDVISAVTGYGDASVNPNPGFENKINLSSLPNGRHTITLKLVSKYGDVMDTISKTIYVYNNISFGVDVSEYNGNIDWNQLRYNGVSFAIIRAGYRGYGTNGTLVTDSKFKTNVVNAHNAGIKVGVYFFSQAINFQEGVAEANYVNNIINNNGLNQYITLPIVIDSENSTGYPNGRADWLTREARTEAVSGFCSTIQASGRKPMIYASKFWFRDKLNMLLLNNYSVWLAHYTYSVDIQSDYTGMYEIWQYSSVGRLPGANGNIDLDVGYGI